MSAKRYLIVNADDFGRSPGINRGVIKAHEHGIVTSASLMVRWPAAAKAAAYGRDRSELSLGIHFDFGEWSCRDYNWVQLYQVVSEDDVSAVAEEASRQLDQFRVLVGKDPTHIDSHQHAHQSERLSPIFVGISRTLGIPLRGRAPGIRYRGDFYGQNEQGWALPEFISVEALVKILAALPPGFAELGCHPGEGADLDSMYILEREQEVKTLCDPRVRVAVAELGIELCSFRDVVEKRAYTTDRVVDASSSSS